MATNGNQPGEHLEHNKEASPVADLDAEHTAALNQIKTASSVNISPELFEKLYLSPINRQNVVRADLRKTFGNPTPIALIGFVISLGPLSADLIGWRGAGGTGAAGIGSYYFFGGFLLVLGGILEFILGNTFPSVVFTSYGAFFLSFAATLQPFYYAYGLYAPPGQPETAGLTTVGFTSSFAFFLVFIAVLSFVFLVLSIRTNIVFVIIFFTLSANGIGNKDQSALALAHRLQVAAGSFIFITTLAGWYLIIAILLAVLDFPFQLPVGDLSTSIKGASAKDNIV
ncbi:hypothetical protein L207DRAFT_613568 [Hyaloscypha variabilis F]|uniref:GPR1/FUN34/YaaH-class plasma membrane protein n=1 Tax=Hyaloscypha variabilis (strain UAMH 11265 / GT02V1 / F) TaxID=1149755 RepID=A0A2J6S7S2_HYAVF|nr:hypothetical protein L207DRAFT_613568 [Hyaloscypha variabilis F]